LRRLRTPLQGRGRGPRAWRAERRVVSTTPSARHQLEHGAVPYAEGSDQEGEQHDSGYQARPSSEQTRTGEIADRHAWHVPRATFAPGCTLVTSVRLEARSPNRSLCVMVRAAVATT